MSEPDAAVLLPASADDAEVPAGVYLLSERCGGAQELAAFRLDRYPVTVARYARFLEAGGYRDRSFWEPGGWKMIELYQLAAPRFWNEPKWQRYLRPDRPVVGVTWWEARAFCRFEKRRLPTEREWEAAARGHDGRIHPWGNEWDDRCAAVRGRGARVTWPVGSFRAGVGPFGHYDLVGNVWQWTDDAVDAGAPNSPRVAKGGSWASPPHHSRTDAWNGWDREAQFSHLGFRTAGSVRERRE